MNNARLYQVLLGPVVTEKSQRLSDQQGVQVFKVLPCATKLEIRRAIELLFPGTEVEAVNTLNRKGKNRRFGRTLGRKQDTKLAYVTFRAIAPLNVADNSDTAAQSESAPVAETAE